MDQTHSMSIRQACKTADIPRSTFDYQNEGKRRSSDHRCPNGSDRASSLNGLFAILSSNAGDGLWLELQTRLSCLYLASAQHPTSIQEAMTSQSQAAAFQAEKGESGLESGLYAR